MRRTLLAMTVLAASMAAPSPGGTHAGTNLTAVFNAVITVPIASSTITRPVTWVGSFQLSGTYHGTSSSAAYTCSASQPGQLEGGMSPLSGLTPGMVKLDWALCASSSTSGTLPLNPNPGGIVGARAAPTYMTLVATVMAFKSLIGTQPHAGPCPTNQMTLLAWNPVTDESTVQLTAKCDIA